MTTRAVLHVDQSGETNPVTLVFLHGGGVSGWMWQPQRDAFNHQYHCLIPDLPGHGRSFNLQPFTIPDAAQQVAQVIREQAHGGKAHLIGLSLGAQVAVQLLADQPDLLHSAVISSALLQPLPLVSLYSSKSVLRWTFLSSVAPIKSSRWYARLNMRRAAGIPETYFAPFYDDFRQITADTFAQVMHANLRFRMPAGLERVQCPVLVINGKREGSAMQASARLLEAALPHAQRYEVAVGQNTAENHNWSLHDPALFNRVLQAWLEQQPLPAAP